ncbi:MAG: lipid A deacylase LpxR family protein [Verrucomicrobiota bacterium]
MRILILILSGMLCAMPVALGEVTTVGSGTVVTLNEENDKYVTPSTDKHYTQGLHVTILWPDECALFWMRPMTWLPDFDVANPIHKYGFTFGQNIYTPIDIQTNALVTDDRPYAGWLYAGLIRENRGTFAGGIPVLDHLEVDAGIIGSWSEADNIQIWFHGLIHVERPKGWHHQLNNEPGLLLNFDRKFLLWDSAAPGDDFHAQMLPHVGINLGNVDTSATIGTMFRLGYNFPNEFATNSPAGWGWYLFSSIDCHAVAYTEFLDGNMYHASHSVDKEPVYAQFRAGLALILRRVEISYTYNYLSKQFDQQDKYDAYASLNLIYRF